MKKLTLIAIFALFGCSGLSAEPINLEKEVLLILEAIKSKNIDALLEYVPSDGLIDDDTHISRNDIAKDLDNKNSSLFKHLFGSSDIACSKDGGKIFVSPAKMMEYSPSDINVSSKKLDKEGNTFNVHISSNIKYKTCDVSVWYSRFKIENNRLYFDSYFFY